MPHDIKKWMGPATSSEVARALLETRAAMIQLYAMIVSLKAENETSYELATKRYYEADSKLSLLIDAIGGLDASER